MRSVQKVTSITILVVVQMLVIWQPIWAQTCPGEMKRQSEHLAQQQKIELGLEAAIRALSEELIRLAQLNDCSLEDNNCRISAGTLKQLIEERFDVEVEAVKNRFHVFLRIPNYYGLGDHLYIDGSYQQFAQGSFVSPEKVFVGSEREFRSELSRVGSSDYVQQRFFFELEPDRFLPSFLDP